MAGLVEGKAGLVTGAAGGIGRATAIALAREGAAGVLVCDLQSRHDDGVQTVRLIEQEGGHAEFLAGDVSVEADCQAAVARTVVAFVRLSPASTASSGSPGRPRSSTPTTASASTASARRRSGRR